MTKILLLLWSFTISVPVYAVTTEPLALDSSISSQNISFYSSGCQTRGVLYKPVSSDSVKWPVIVMAPGFSGVKESGYIYFAEQFAKAGFAVLLFDYPNFGGSESKVAQEVDPWMQVQAYRDAITYVAEQSFIDSKRIGVWGGSYSGGHAIAASNLDGRVACYVAMTPFISGSKFWEMLPAASRDYLTKMFQKDRSGRIKGEKPMMIPVVTNQPRAFSAVSGMDAWNYVEWFKKDAPLFQNQVTLKSLEMQLEYEPGVFINRRPHLPKLFMVASKDENIPENHIETAFIQADEPKSLVTFEGHHFSGYQEQRDRTIGFSVEFFKKYLSSQ